MHKWLQRGGGAALAAGEGAVASDGERQEPAPVVLDEDRVPEPAPAVPPPPHSNVCRGVPRGLFPNLHRDPVFKIYLKLGSAGPETVSGGPGGRAEGAARPQVLVLVQLPARPSGPDTTESGG